MLRYCLAAQSALTCWQGMNKNLAEPGWLASESACYIADLRHCSLQARRLWDPNTRQFTCYPLPDILPVFLLLGQAVLSAQRIPHCHSPIQMSPCPSHEQNTAGKYAIEHI